MRHTNLYWNFIPGGSCKILCIPIPKTENTAESYATVSTSLDGLEGNASVSGIMDQETGNLFSAQLPSWARAYHVTRRCRSSDMTFEAVEVEDAVDLFQGVGGQFHARGGETGIELRWLRGAHDHRAHDRQP